MITGWAATHAVWKRIIPALRQYGQVNPIQPPWLKAAAAQASLDNFDLYVEKLSKVINTPTHIIAWSLGGLIAIAAASKKAQAVKSICFISSTPKFVCQNNHNSGIDYQWFKSFAAAFDAEPIGTLEKFLWLQSKGDNFAGFTLQFLKNNFDFENYDLQECKRGLVLLEELNLLDKLAGLACKKVFIHGDKDAVVNLQAARLACQSAQAEMHVIQGAGHVPQVSHYRAVADIITHTITQALIKKHS